MATPTTKHLEKRIETLENTVKVMLEVLTFPGRYPPSEREDLVKGYRNIEASASKDEETDSSEEITDADKDPLT